MENESIHLIIDRETFDVICNKCNHNFILSVPFGYSFKRPVLCRCERCGHPIINPGIHIGMLDNDERELLWKQS